MTDIRHREIKIKIREGECAIDTIKRYMKRKGFTHFVKTTMGNLKHDMYYSDDYYEIWVQSEYCNSEHTWVKFTLN